MIGERTVNNSKKEKGKKQKQDPRVLKFASWLMLVVCAVLVIIAMHLHSKARAENEKLRDIIKMATFYIEGDLPRAANYLDFLDYSGSRLPEEFRPLAERVRNGFSLYLFERTRREFQEGKLGQAENDFEVAKFYAAGSNLDKNYPCWVKKLGATIKFAREEQETKQELAKIHTAKGWIYHYEGKRSEAISEYRKALEYSPDHEPAKEALRSLGENP